MKRILIYVFIAVVFAGAAFIVFQTIDKKRSREYIKAEQTAIQVDVDSVVLHEFQEETCAIGTLKARETNLLSPKVAGNVDAVLVDIGDMVETGQVVVLLDRTRFKLTVNQAEATYKTAVAAVAQSKSQFEQANKVYDRASKLLAEKVIPQGRFDAAEAAYKTANEALNAAKGKHSQTETALEAARDHLKDSRIRSSITGVVVNRNVEVGQYVAPGVQIFRILDQTTVKVDVELPEKDFGLITIGTTAIITVDAFKDREFSGKVKVVNPMVDPHVRTFRVRIEASNPSGKLVDGMFARVRFLTGKRTALAVPRDTLQRMPGSGTFYVFVVEKDRAYKRTVKIAAMNDQYAEVEDGLAKGKKIVISGTGRLRSGTKVIVK